jgi:hypothetical protein
MGDPQTLSGFITWTHAHYPAQHYYLAIADHGRGTSGVAWDNTSSKDNLTTSDLRAALRSGTNNGQWKIDVLHYDTCLMAMLEDAYQAKDDANYMVASENLGWSLFAYDRYVQTTTAATTPRQLAINVAYSYFSHPNLQGYPRTISALDLSRAVPMRQTLDTLAAALRANLNDTTRSQVQTARNNAQKFDSRNYREITNDDEYLDLSDLAANLQLDVTNTVVQQAAQATRAAIGSFVIAEHHQSGGRGWNLDKARGLAIYFPPDKSSSDYTEYVKGQLFQFTADSQWDEFLAEYFGLTTTPAPAPDPGLPPMLEPVKIYLPIIAR